jgi:hypothetical protein
MKEGQKNIKNPEHFGTFWKEHEGGKEYYEWMYEYRKHCHEAFRLWFKAMDKMEPFKSVIEFGCGYAIGYSEFFADIRYVGVDLAEKAIDWCKANLNNPLHEYLVADFIKEEFNEEFDLVFSHATIDNNYDMDRYLKSAVSASSRWIWITAYRSFSPDLLEHRYTFAEDQGVYYNDISPTRAYRTLVDCGCRNVSLLPYYTGREDIPYETLIIARTDD